METLTPSPLILMAMEESTIDLLMDSEPVIAPMAIKAGLILAFMLGLVAWRLLAEWRD